MSKEIKINISGDKVSLFKEGWKQVAQIAMILF